MWAKAVALPATDTTWFVDTLLNIFTQLQFPNQILTDNGSQFRGKLMIEVFELLHTHHIHTRPYHPQLNGQTEWFNGTIMSILRKLIQEKPEIWDEYLTATIFVYQEVPCQSHQPLSCLVDLSRDPSRLLWEPGQMRHCAPQFLPLPNMWKNFTRDLRWDRD